MICSRYVIIEGTVTNEMINSSTSYRAVDARINNIDTKTVLEFCLPVPEVFMPYQVYTHTDILVELEEAEWNE